MRRRRKTDAAHARPIRRAVIFGLLSLAMEQASASPRFVSEPVTTAKAEERYTYEVVVTGIGNVNLSAPNGLPPWLTLTITGSGTATLTGVPANEDTGESIFLRAEDQDLLCRFFQDTPCVAFQQFDISIIPNFPPEIVPPGIADQTADEAQPFVLDTSDSFTDPENDALRFSATGLPPSLSIDSSGVISGTPTLADVQDSPFTISVTATDQNGRRVSDVFLLTILEAPGADIGINMTGVTGDSVLVDVTASWVFEVTNDGPADSAILELTVDFLGNPITLIDHPCLDAVSENQQSLSCDMGTLAAGASGTITVTGMAAQPGDVYLVASVAGSGSIPRDPVAENNRVNGGVSVARALSAEAAQSVTASSANAIAGGDLNADGFDDLGIVTAADSPTAIHLNIEDPTTLHPMLGVPGNSRRGLGSVPFVLQDNGAGTGLVFSDLDGDGDVDLVTTNATGSPNIVFSNDGIGVLTEFARLGSNDVDTRSVAAGDLNGDGLNDLVFANAGPHHVYMNEGAGFALAASLDEGGADSVVLLDVDVDGLPDIVFAGGDGRATLFRNLGLGSFGDPEIIEPGPTTSVASGDFNGDGLADLVFARRDPGPAGLPSNPVYLNDGAGAFLQASELGAAPTIDVVAADFDDDGFLDVVSINATATHQVFLGDGDGNFRLHPTQLASPSATGGAVGRFGYSTSVGLALNGTEGLKLFLNDGQGNIGLGDLQPPVISLIGSREVSLEVGVPYEDAGATAVDELDGLLMPSVDNPVDTAVVGEYAVTYTVVDSSGNAAAPVARVVRIGTREPTGGGGGGALDIACIVLLLLAHLTRWRRRGASPFARLPM